MSVHSVNADFVAPRYSDRVQLVRANAIDATLVTPSVTGGTFTGITMTSPVVSGGSLSGCTILSPTVSAGTFSTGTILSPTIVGGTLVNISTLSMVTTTGSFTVSGFENTSGAPITLVPGFHAYYAAPLAHLIINGMGATGSGAALTIPAGSIPVAIRPGANVYLPVYVDVAGTGAWGLFVVSADGSATYYATADEGTFGDAAAITVREVNVSWNMLAYS